MTLARRWTVLALGAACVGVLGVVVALATAATAPVVVSLSVPSAVTFGNGCGSSGYSLGTVLPGSAATTSTTAGACRFTFGSSNDTAMLRLAQADGTGTAMGAGPRSYTWSLGLDQNLDDVSAVDGSSNVAYATQWDGHIYKTGNGGSSWTLQYTVPYGLSSVSAGDATHAFAVSTSGVAYRTTDGSTWAAVTLPPGAGGWDMTVDMVDPSTVYASTAGHVFRSLDASAGTPTWTDITSGVPTNITVHLWAVSASTVVIASTAGVVARSTGADGASPSFSALSGVPPGGWNGVSSTDGTHIFVVGYSGASAYTPDGGATWVGYAIPAQFWDLWDVTATGTTSAVAVGGNGMVWSTADGSSWTRNASVASHSTKTEQAVSANASWTYVAGAGKQVERSNDGTTYVKSTSFSDGLGFQNGVLGIDAGTSTTVFAVGMNGIVERSTDGGVTWAAETSPTTNHLRAVSAVDATYAWAAGDAGTVLRRTGSGWAAATTGFGATDALLAVSAVDASTAFVAGESGKVLLTTDGGSTWSNVGPGGGTLRAVAAVSASVVYAAGDGGRVVRSVNGGASWTTQTLTGGGTIQLRGLSAVDASTAWVVGGFGKLWRTVDGGSTAWTLATGNVNGGPPLYGVDAVSADVLWVSGQNGLHRSANAGATWENVSFDDRSTAAAVTALGDGTALVASGGGGIGKAVPNPAAAAGVPDYTGTGAQAWTGAGALFGVCVQSLPAPVVPVWTTTGSCTANDANGWHGVPTAATKVAKLTTTGQTGTIDLVWGFRPAANQAPGTFAASVVVEVLAPDV